VLAVNRQPVNSAAELADKIAATSKQRGAALLHISRQGQIFFRAIEMDKK
jgi:hypothetical protein